MRRLFFLVLLLGSQQQSTTTAQLTYPKLKQVHAGCQSQHVEQCRMGCPAQYHDTERYLCPCYSKLARCLVEIGCSMKQKVDIFAFCTRKGYCKDGYCKFRAGDLTPRVDTRPEVFALTSVATPGTPCIDNCCAAQQTAGGCAQNATLLTVRAAGRAYRKQEVALPPRQGDPRLGVNQDYDRMPYSIPLANIP
uniref:Uncharacterized protein n=1 Tax=Globisporangium ultimum (strain ATCC 200006 / CBS 805.95 / DAOM BR144) TaxID=431595 RepID=K3X8B2_GLOUD